MGRMRVAEQSMPRPEGPRCTYGKTHFATRHLRRFQRHGPGLQRGRMQVGQEGQDLLGPLGASSVAYKFFHGRFHDFITQPMKPYLHELEKIVETPPVAAPFPNLLKSLIGNWISSVC